MSTMISPLLTGLSTEPMPENPFHCFKTGFTPWGCPAESPSPKPVISNNSSNGSDPTHVGSISSNSDDQTGTVRFVDERKRRRMISNRESARRSRMRKQKHLENLRNQVNRLRNENRELINRVGFVLHHLYMVRTDNDRLLSEQYMLQQKLLDMQPLLMLQHQRLTTSPAWPTNNNLLTSGQIPSLIA